MPPLTPELEAYILTQIESLFFDVTTFTNEINKQVSLLTANGLSQKQIINGLSNDLKNNGRIFGQLKNNTKAKVVETVNQSSRIGQESEYSGNEKFAWVTVGGHKVCLDCEGRTGMIMTYDQWETEGLPGTGWSVCQGYCYCVLDPTGTVGKKVQVDTTKIKPEKGASIRASTLNKAQILQNIKRYTTSTKLPEHLEKFVGPNQLQRILKKAKLDINTVVNFKGASLETLDQISRGIADTLGRYNININYIGNNIKGLTMRNAAAAAWRISNNSYNAISYNSRFLKDWKKIKDSSVENFARRKKIKILNAQTRLERIKGQRANYSSESRWLEAVADAEENLATWSSSKFSRYSASSDIYGTSVHESWHIIDYKLNPKELLRVDFKNQLRFNNVKRSEWYHVSEYGGGSLPELWAETGAALDQGFYVPDGIKKAFIKTIENAGYTYP